MMRHPESIRVFAPAKVNLALHVTARRKDGYHLLDSVVAFADVGDVLQARRADGFRLELAGSEAGALSADADNLVLKAAQALNNAWPETFGGCHFRLEKHLPVASGIGGGSADAAAALRAMIRLYGPPPVREPDEALSQIALEIGADVPVCLAGHACRMRGIGEDIAPIAAFPELQGLLVNPRVAVSTAAVFSRLGLAPGGTGFPPLAEPLPEGNAETWLQWLMRQRNDLQSPACACAPEIAACLSLLKELPDVRLVRMSGSGATCFALFDDEAAALRAARMVQNQRPQWWVAPVRLGDAAKRERGT